ncbi:MAG: hypothetical protein ACE5G7_04075 [Candidatus Hydrothermarchaeaceae archaeon]
MGEIDRPANWDEMDYGEKLIWLFEKQQELKREIEGAFGQKA